MKKFNVKFTPIVIILLSIIICLFVVSVVMDILQIANNEIILSKKIIKIIFIVVDIASIVLATSTLFFSRYKITEKEIVYSLGFVKTRYNIAEIVEINHFKKSDKLVVYFCDEKFTVILISPKNYDEFIKFLREKNRKIVFDEGIEKELEK